MTADNELSRRDFLRGFAVASVSAFGLRTARNLPSWLKEPLSTSKETIVPGEELIYDQASEQFNSMYGFSATKSKGGDKKTLLTLTNHNYPVESGIKVKLLNENVDPNILYGTPLSFPGLVQHSPYVTSYANQDHYVTSTMGVNSSGTYEFWTQKIGLDGSVIGEPQLLLGGITDHEPLMYDVIPNPNGEETLVIWYTNYPNGYHGAIISSTGEVKANIPILDKAKIYWNYEKPSASFNPNTGEYDVIWFRSEKPVDPFQGELCLASIKSDGSFGMQPKVLDSAGYHMGSKLVSTPDGNMILAFTKDAYPCDELVAAVYKDPREVQVGNLHIVGTGDHVGDVLKNPDIAIKDGQTIIAWSNVIYDDSGSEVDAIFIRNFNFDLTPRSDAKQITPMESGNYRNLPVIVTNDNGLCTVLYMKPEDYFGTRGSPVGMHITVEEDKTQYNYLPIAIRSSGT
jgi:hypothetical protein